MNTNTKVKRLGIPSTLILWLLALGFAVPVAWFLLSSFKPGSELFSLPLTLFPEDWTVSGYSTAWNRFNFAQYFMNTAIVAIVTTALTVVVSAMTGYAFAKYNAWWLKAFFICILATTMLPTEVIMPSSFAVVRDLGLYNTLAGIIVPSIITATGIFMFRQYFKTIPDELLEAARIDGVSEFGAFWRIMLPLAKPIAVVLAIFSFQWRWNDYIWPLIVLRDPSQYTLQVALRSIVGADNIDWSVLLAASVISLVPMVVLFAIFQRQIMNADINSGLKD
ncbi:alpha-1,4-digalacturonate transport system permease protein [Microbacterium terrae]|uniref:L-arabinose transport system permease protein AraQ n=1 Tax=Microbacterium terrae TaxID=69369 RepID=A0A0M2HFU1_9MICO|nr:carbohydrate ABC transporter permease [Microbacterium terrae]KJL45547.1 L-arabinose transport system permease protein AraQ [Microbacterium terrae]MBP1079382.1 alpha-1,4-digalacturonate transport system permease protein [Microbacterium terrae]GLJ98782.1 sugar ABC transporter permease [Microbacterium terrae]